MDEEPGDFDAAAFPISETAAVSDFLPLAAEKTMTARMEPSPVYSGDEGQSRRLFFLLWDNAVKSCDPEGEIAVRLFPRGGGLCSVSKIPAKMLAI